MTNGGSASMAKVVLLEAWSNSRFGRRAACIAIGKATAKAMICEMMISSRSIGNDCGDDARRRLVRREGLAQVALEDVADPDEVLLPQRLVQAELVVDAWRRSARCRWARGWWSVGLPGSRWTRKKEATDTKRMMMMSSTNLLVM